MTRPIRLLDLGVIPAARTQSIYHAIAEELTPDSPDTIVFCRPMSPYVCVGYHQQVESVLDRAACEQFGVPILRRRVGGGLTWLDSDQFFYQCIFHNARVPSFFGAIFQMLLRAPVRALCALGLSATLDDVNEIRVDGTRIAGTGGGMIGEAGVVVGNVLFDFDYARMARVWRVPSDACRELASAALCEHVTTLRRLGKTSTMQELAHLLTDAYASTLGRPLVPGELTRRELERAEQLDAELGSAEFLELRDEHPREEWGPLKIAAGVYIHAMRAAFDGVDTDGYVWVENDLIRRAVFNSPGSDSLDEQLRGKSFEEWRAGVERSTDA